MKTLIANCNCGIEINSTLDIIKYFHDNNITIKQAECILELVLNQIAYQRERFEYDTIENYLAKTKVYDASNDIVNLKA